MGVGEGTFQRKRTSAKVGDVMEPGGGEVRNPPGVGVQGVSDTPTVCQPSSHARGQQ